MPNNEVMNTHILPSTVTRWGDYIRSASASHGIPADVIAAVIDVESSGIPTCKSSAGAVGLMQLMPATAQEMGVTDRTNPQQNINGGTKYLRYLYDKVGGNYQQMLRAYNGGLGNKDNPKLNKYYNKVMSRCPNQFTTGVDNVYGGTSSTSSATGQSVQLFHAEDKNNIQKWGLLRYFEEISNPSIGDTKAKQLLKLYDRKTRELKITDAFGTSDVRAGSLIPVFLNLGDVVTSNYMLVTKVTHKYSNDKYTMDLTLEGAWDD